MTVELRNDGEHPHEAALIKVPDDYTEDQFAEEFAAVQEGGPLPAAFEAITGTPEVEGGESATFKFLAD